MNQPRQRGIRAEDFEELAARLMTLWHGGSLGQLSSSDFNWIIFSLGNSCRACIESDLARVRFAQAKRAQPSSAADDLADDLCKLQRREYIEELYQALGRKLGGV